MRKATTRPSRRWSIPKTYPFKVGDRIRLTVEPFTKSYIYIFHVGASGKQMFLLPREIRARRHGAGARAQVGGAAAGGCQKAGLAPQGRVFRVRRPSGQREAPGRGRPEARRRPERAGQRALEVQRPQGRAHPRRAGNQEDANATVEANLKSVQEREIEKRDQVVKFRGIGDEADRKDLAQDVQTRAPVSATLEVPGQNPVRGPWLCTSASGPATSRAGRPACWLRSR